VQPATQVKHRSASSTSGKPLAIIAVTGDVSSEAGEAILNAYQSLDSNPAYVLLDFSRVSYINSSGIAIVIQLLIEARSKGGPSIGIFGLSRHFQKVFSLVGIDKYAPLHADEATALASLP
jgi:anti-sigma B factor antagonist